MFLLKQIQICYIFEFELSKLSYFNLQIFPLLSVLMWEVITLGQQPYQGQTNVEVLQHVRGGGRLPRPIQNCTEEL